MKEYAVLRAADRRRVLCVRNEDDWAEMKTVGAGGLVCPAEGCDSILVACTSKKEKRFLRYHNKARQCGHSYDPNGGGGVEGSEHLWIKNRVAQICNWLGYDVEIEHQPSQADIWVHSDPPLAIEIQRWDTDIEARTRSREQLGAQTIWLFTEGASSAVDKYLFKTPAARVRVYEKNDGANGRKPIKPWLSECKETPYVYIGATVLSSHRSGRMLGSAGNYDAMKFFRQVLAGDRIWVAPESKLAEHGGGWALRKDIQELKRLRARQAARHESAAFRMLLDKQNNPGSRQTTSASIAELYAKSADSGSASERRIPQQISEANQRDDDRQLGVYASGGGTEAKRSYHQTEEATAKAKAARSEPMRNSFVPPSRELNSSASKTNQTVWSRFLKTVKRWFC